MPPRRPGSRGSWRPLAAARSAGHRMACVGSASPGRLCPPTSRPRFSPSRARPASPTRRRPRRCESPAARSRSSSRTFAPGDLIVVNGGTDNGIDVGQEYFARRAVPIDRGPVSRDNPATIHTSGWIRIYAVDQADVARDHYVRLRLGGTERLPRAVRVARHPRHLDEPIGGAARQLWPRAHRQ